MTKQLTTILTLAALALLWPLSVAADEWDQNNYPPVNIVAFEQTNLPIAFIDTKDDNNQPTPIHKDYRVAVRMKIIDNGDAPNYADTLAHPGQRVDYEGWVAIKYRGNSSFKSAKKKPFGFKTLATSDVDGKKQKVEILGMPKDNDWVMLAPYHDRSLMRDVLMFEMARPYFEFTPKARHCELVLDGVYRGVYVICEKAGKGKNRLNLTDPGDEGDDVTGDFQLQVDGDDEPNYTSKYPARDEKGRALLLKNKVHLQYKFPEYDDMMPDHPAQLAYIQQCIDRMEDALNSDNFKDPLTGYRKYIDVQSFVDNMLSQEFSANPDAYRRSTNIYKRRDSVDPRFKVTLWDFNLAFGNSYNEPLTNSSWLFYNDPTTNLVRASPVPFWWQRLVEDPYYVDQLKKRWTEYRHKNYTLQNINHKIDSLETMLNVGGASQRNYEAWPNWNENIYLTINVAKNYKDEIAYLRQWIERRMAWLDDKLGFDPSARIPGDVNNDGTVDVGDIMAIINTMAATPATTLPGDATNENRADVNGDGQVDVGDIMAVINLMASAS